MRAIFAEQPALAECLRDPTPPGLLAPHVDPPLTRDEADGLDLILEGFLLHHGRPRLLGIADPGRRVLAGDFCYARGLVAVAAAGDLYVIEALADLIALSAGLVAQDARDDLPALWTGTVAAIAGDDDLRHAVGLAKRALKSGSDPAPMRHVAGALTPIPGLQEALR